MAGEKQNAPWPIPKFHFKVSLGNLGDIAFQEVSGLDEAVDVVEYRAGNSTAFSTVKMPGLKKVGNVTLKKGVYTNNDNLFKWINSAMMNAIERKDVTILLLDEKQKASFSWTLKNAFPVKVTGTDLNAMSNEVAIEKLVLAHEGFTMENL